MSEHHKSHPDYEEMGIFAGYMEFNGPQTGFDVVIVFEDGEHQFVPGSHTILWYDWNGEWHYV